MNFIRFNAEEMVEETGQAPVRAYYCETCCGWHVTSRGCAAKLYSRLCAINRKVGRLLKGERFAEAARMLSHAEEIADDYAARCFLSEQEEKAVEGLKRVRYKLHAARYHYFRARSKEFNETSRFSIVDLEHNPHEIEVVQTTLNTEQGRMEYQVRPFLLYKEEGKFVYAIIRHKMSRQDLAQLQEDNLLSDEESFESYSRHSLDIVGVKRDDEVVHEFQYGSLQSFLHGDILLCRIKGTALRLFIKNSNATKPKYHNVRHYDYWIKIGDRNVRFFGGNGNNYTCLVTSREIAQDRTIKVVCRVPKRKLEELKAKLEA